ncbi:unnamed protein product [Leptidea sinapis]|uniref:Uncharacterized protein n=1 Tax=Leptidea sinapis TaxID=189913 RepID=A0A5E4QY53_9NEOP|nr:unnamed protein product [Leptidea sinapis]
MYQSRSPSAARDIYSAVRLRPSSGPQSPRLLRRRRTGPNTCDRRSSFSPPMIKNPPPLYRFVWLMAAG